jgi:hypothetical protein
MRPWKQRTTPWHNYANLSLRMDASPNNEPVWRVVDWARIVNFIETDTGDINAVLEIKIPCSWRWRIPFCELS